MAPGSISEVKKQKKSAFSCEPCRTRKVKCGGEKPVCNRCKARKDTCLYKLAPTLSYTQKLESRIKELEKALSQAQQNGPNCSPKTIASSHSPNSTINDVASSTFKGIAFDSRGSVNYQGSTSFFQLPVAPRSLTSEGQPLPSPSITQNDSGRQRLVQNAWFQRALEVLSETPEPFQYLLNNHWCWIQPLFNFVYRPAFTRDMQNLGSYYSHTLLNAMLAHSVRWCKREPEIQQQLEPYDGGVLFSRHARSLLFDELSQGHCRIPTVQVCLLLSAQECGRGNKTQAWVYCGIAFRLIEDMGITVDDQRYSGDVQLSDEDKEVRRRLFWSAYFWDKLVSLYLGRSPTLRQSPLSPPQLIMDDSAEEEVWKPHGINFPAGRDYPPTKAHSISCFTQMCRLSVIFHEILVHMYDPAQPKSETEVEECLHREGEGMRRWWLELPDFLKIEALALPEWSPPSHIVTLNCLYHTFKILLYRPMLFRRPYDQAQGYAADPTHFKECLASATAITATFDLFCRTFGYGRVVLSLAYSLYTAASIFLLQIQASNNKDGKDKDTKDESTLHRMQFCVQGLHRVQDSSPVIGNALKLILKALEEAGIDTSSMIEQQAQPAGLSPNPSFTFAPTQNLTQFDLNPDNALYNYNNQNGTSMPTQSHVQAVEAYDPNILDFSPEMFEAFSGLEPISATVDGMAF